MLSYNLSLVNFILIGAVFVAIIWGCYELFDWIFIDDIIYSTKPITPEIKLVVKNNIVDTIYVYRK